MLLCTISTFIKIQLSQTINNHSNACKYSNCRPTFLETLVTIYINLYGTFSFQQNNTIKSLWTPCSGCHLSGVNNWGIAFAVIPTWDVSIKEHQIFSLRGGVWCRSTLSSPQQLIDGRVNDCTFSSCLQYGLSLNSIHPDKYIFPCKLCGGGLMTNSLVIQKNKTY